MSIPDWLDEEPWSEYVKMRKKIKKPLTDYAIKLAIQKLEKFKDCGFNPSDVLNQSIFNSHQGLFEPKPEFVTQSNSIDCPVDEIIGMYRVIQKRLSICRDVSPMTKANISQVWGSNTGYQKMTFWERFFKYCEQNDFLTGQVDNRNRECNFVASLRWIVDPENFIKIINEEYS